MNTRKNKKILRNKNVLVTAGPVWVSIDKVRVISNIFAGNLGLIIAKLAVQMGAKVTLLIGPGGTKTRFKESKNFKIIKFKYFDELLALVEQEVSSKKYDVIIHSAAVSDYVPIVSKKKKIKSGKKELVIRLKPTVKIVDLIKRLDPSVFLVKFKLEVGLSEKDLINVAYKGMLASKADLMVANNMETVRKKNGHEAFVIDTEKNIKKFKSKEDVACGLLGIIELNL